MPKEDPKGILYFEFGEIGDTRKITSSAQIPWRIDGKYGWAATIFSKDPQVVLKEKLIFPDPADSSDSGPKEKPEQIKSVETSEIEDQMLSREVTLDVTKPLTYGRVYTIIGNDPRGPHVLRPYVNGELTQEVNFTIKENAEGGADQPASRPESRSEGRDKPQTEAEGRPR